MKKLTTALAVLIVTALMPLTAWASSVNSTSGVTTLKQGEPVGSAYTDSTKSQVATEGDMYTPIYLKIVPNTGIYYGSTIWIETENGRFDNNIYPMPLYTSAAGNSYDTMLDALNSGMPEMNLLQENLGDSGAELPYRITNVSDTCIGVDLFPISEVYCNKNSHEVCYTKPYYYIPLHIIASNEGILSINIIDDEGSVSEKSLDVAYVYNMTKSFPVEGGRVYYDNQGWIVDCDASVTRAVIPDNVGGANIAGFKMGAFENCRALTEVVIPENITDIPTGLFMNCHSLVSVSIPDTIKTIGERAFENCSSLKRVDLKGGVTEIGKSAFRGTAIEEFTMPAGINDAYGVFEGCNSLKKLTFEEGLKTIPYGMFLSGDPNTSLKSVVIPDSVTCIDSLAFANCKGLESITIPSGVREFNKGVFRDCTALKEVILPDTMEDIGWETFSNCPCLESIKLPGKITSLNGMVFYKCTALKEVVVPYGVTIIGDYTFSCCTALTKVYIPASVNEIYSNIFEGCNREALTLYVTEGSYGKLWARQNGFNYETTGEINYGDADGNGYLTATDCSYIIQKVLDNSYRTPVEEYTGSEAAQYLDINKDGIISAEDAAYVLQKTLDAAYEG